MKYYPGSLVKVKEEAENYLNKDYAKLGIKKENAGDRVAQTLFSRKRAEKP